eukprot:6183726-Pleurochrysis_carterae.AAC.1
MTANAQCINHHCIVGCRRAPQASCSPSGARQPRAPTSRHQQRRNARCAGVTGRGSRLRRCSKSAVMLNARIYRMSHVMRAMVILGMAADASGSSTARLRDAAGHANAVVARKTSTNCLLATDVCSCSALGHECGWCSSSSTCRPSSQCTTTCRECPASHKSCRS